MTKQFNKRLLLVRLYKLFLLICFIGLLSPFLLSLSVFISDSEEEVIDNWAVSVPLKNLSAGKIYDLPWNGGLYWVYKRTDKEVKSLKAINDQPGDSNLRDAASQYSDQPVNMANNSRSASEYYFVFVPLETRRSCQVRLYDDESPVKFTEPCFGSQYDVAGRVFKESGHKDQKNLSVPMHKIENGILKIAVWIKQ